MLLGLREITKDDVRDALARRAGPAAPSLGGRAWWAGISSRIGCISM
ncbi:hypothetical protein ACWGDX_33025 [Streptomyces sp. NPDC055025]